MALQATRLATPDREDELRDLGAIQAWAFAFPPPDAEAWLARAGHENVRVLRRGREVLGGLLLVPMGQFFGRRSVPMVGIAGVAVAPDRRRAGLGATLCRETVRELHRGRVP